MQLRKHLLLKQNQISSDPKKPCSKTEVPTEKLPDTIDDNESEPLVSESDQITNDAILLKQLKEKSAVLSKMGGEVDSEVSDIINPVNIAKIENDLADDILNQIEAEKPPDYVGDKPLFPIALSQTSNPPKPPTPSNPLPKRPMQPSSMLQLACNYGHESESDTEDPEPDPPKKSAGPKLLPVTGQLDSLGRIVFNTNSASADWQTEEQREALESYKQQQQQLKTSPLSNGGADTHNKDIKESMCNTASRRKRLALPGGRFNKTDLSEKSEVSTSEIKNEYKPSINFIKSSTIPGSINEEEKNTETASINDDDVSTLTTDLVDKLEYFKVGGEKVSPLKTLAIKLETLYSAWSAGALSLPYMSIVLQNAKSKIRDAEEKLSNSSWKAEWDREKRTYVFRNEMNGEEPNQSEESSEEEVPPLPPPESNILPPLPPPDQSAPAPPSADHQLQDMDIDDEPTLNITDEISNFYSEINETEVTPSPTGNEALEEDSVSNASGPSSGPCSPTPTESKKRKKVKVSNNIALKKKGVVGMLAKWQKINN